jgi:hypothetical protein
LTYASQKFRLESRLHGDRLSAGRCPDIPREPTAFARMAGVPAGSA